MRFDFTIDNNAAQSALCDMDAFALGFCRAFKPFQLKRSA